MSAEHSQAVPRLALAASRTAIPPRLPAINSGPFQFSGAQAFPAHAERVAWLPPLELSHGEQVGPVDCVYFLAIRLDESDLCQHAARSGVPVPDCGPDSLVPGRSRP